MRNPNFLILDAPTNDLDIPTLNVLEDYLRSFKGCLIVVSHDRYFMDKVVDHLFVFRGNGVVDDFPGNYTQFREQGGILSDTPKPADKPKPAATQPDKPQNRQRKLSFKEKREMEELKTRIPLLEQEKSALEAQLSGGLTDTDAIAKASARYEEVQNLLDEAEMRWLELSEI